MEEVTRHALGGPGRITMIQEEAESVELKQLIRRFYEQSGAQGAVDLLTPNCLIEHPIEPGPLRGPEGFARIMNRYRQAFPDLQYTITDLMVEDGHKAAARAEVWGTNTGSWKGLPATNKPATWTTMAIFHFHNGLINRIAVAEDLLSLVKQLGINPVDL